jgi:hypothetical protein
MSNNMPAYVGSQGIVGVYTDTNGFIFPNTVQQNIILTGDHSGGFPAIVWEDDHATYTTEKVVGWNVTVFSSNFGTVTRFDNPNLIGPLHYTDGVFHNPRTGPAPVYEHDGKVGVDGAKYGFIGSTGNGDLFPTRPPWSDSRIVDLYYETGSGYKLVMDEPNIPDGTF